MTRGGLISTLPPLGPRSARAKAASKLPYPLAEPNLTLFAWGRSSLHAGVTALGLGDGDEVLAPAYHHGSEIEAIARAGAASRFYVGTDELEPDEAELEALLGPRVRALHLTHYLGFPQRASHWRSWCDDRGLFLIEDAAQAWLATEGGRPLGSFGDVAMFCLYKMAPVPDGGALVSSAAPGPAPATGRLGLSRAAKGAGLWLAQRSSALARVAHRARGSADFDADAAMDLGVAAAPSRVTTTLLPRLDYARIRSCRRRNYAYLLERLAEHVPSPFDRLTEGAVPWLFPIAATDKAGLLAYLERHGILAADFWSAAHRSLEAEAAAALRERRGSTIGLPVHQELRQADLDRIAAAVSGHAARPA